MAYEIFAMGDAKLLAQMFEGVALFTGGGDWQVMIKIGLLVGMMFGFAKAIITGKLDLTPMIVGFFIYAIMFMPKVTVNIVDPYGDLPSLVCADTASSFGVSPNGCLRDPVTKEIISGAGGVITIDNVPIGVAAPSYIASSIGLGLTSKFSQVFGAPNMFEKGDGYLNAVRILAKLRNFDGGNQDVNGDSEQLTLLKRTIVLYWRSCVQPEIDGGQKSFGAIQKAPDIVGAIQSANLNRDVEDLTVTTPATTANPFPMQKSCKVAGEAIKAHLDDASYVGAILAGLSSKGISTSKGLDSAIQDITQDATLDSAQVAKNVMLHNLIKCANTGMTSQDCVAVTQASMQQQSQLAAEQSLFKQTMRPLMAFIEMFSVGATPIMAFLIASGLGLALASKYFQLMAWIALWPVTMTLCNIYIYSNASRATINALPDPNTPATILSMTGMESMFTTAADWVATGGMMASATPVLTFFLVTGSAQAFQSLAGKLQGGDHLNEKQMAPDITAPSAITQGQSQYTVSPALGGGSVGTGTAMPQFSGQVDTSSALANSQAAVTAKSDNLTSTYGHEIGAGLQKAHTNGSMSQFVNSAEQGMSREQRAALTTTRQKAIESGVSAETIDSMSNEAKVMAGLGLKLAGTGVGTDLVEKYTKGKSAKESEAIKNAWSTMSQSVDSSASTYRTAMSSQNGTSVTDTLTSGMKKEDKAAFQSTVGQLHTAQDQVQESQSTQQKLGASANMDAMQWAGALKNAGQGQNVVNSAFGLGLGNQARANADLLMKNNGMSAEHATIAGAGLALVNAGQGGNAEALNRFADFHGMASGIRPDVQGPSQNLAGSHYAVTQAAGNAGASTAEQRTDGVAAAVAPAEDLKPHEAKPGTGAPKLGFKPLGEGNNPPGYVAPSSAAPSPESLKDGQQQQFGANAKANLKPDINAATEVASRVPDMVGNVTGGADQAVQNAIVESDHPGLYGAAYETAKAGVAITATVVGTGKVVQGGKAVGKAVTKGGELVDRGIDKAKGIAEKASTYVRTGETSNPAANGGIQFAKPLVEDAAPAARQFNNR